MKTFFAKYSIIDVNLVLNTPLVYSTEKYLSKVEKKDT